MLRIRNAVKSYRMGKATIPVLKGVSLDVQAGEFLSIVGPSGSGKSTFLNILGLLDQLDSGTLELNNQIVTNLSERKAARYRSENIGFIFQSFHLLPFKSALENVMLPLYYQKVPRRERKKRALYYLETLGLRDVANNFPSELSGGEAQRVAIARAFVTEPKIVLGDEPTGSLDSKNSSNVLDCVEEINQNGVTVVIVTHDIPTSARATRTVKLNDGILDT